MLQRPRISVKLLLVLICFLYKHQEGRNLKFVGANLNSRQIYSSNYNQNLQDADEESNNGNKNDNNEAEFAQLAESLASSAAALASTGQSTFEPKCERIAFSFCSTMPYNSSRMSNFFGDKNQIEAADRARQYEPLLRSHCNRHLLSYLCELLAPMCLDGEAMKKFEIFPCRSFCRQVKRDCEEPLLELLQQQQGLSRQLLVASSLQLRAAFQCDQLPYESNGGEGSLRGPCHEMPETLAGFGSAPNSNQAHQNNHNNQPSRQLKQPTGTNFASNNQQQQQNNYWPYQPALDNNVPPFITDTSQLDLNVLRPTNLAKNPATQTQTQSTTTNNSNTPIQSGGFLAQSNRFLQTFSQTLMRYSNLLSIVTLLCLLALLNAKRLARAKCLLSNQLCPSSRKSSSSSSGSSSVGSQRKLATAKVTMSPSSSSRSLMLFAGQSANGQLSHQHQVIGTKKGKQMDGGRAQLAGFQECASTAPSQKLLQVATNQRTLINVNGTLERLSRYQQLMQQHQYDYIQYDDQSSQLAPSSGGDERPSMASKQLGDFDTCPTGFERARSSRFNQRANCSQPPSGKAKQQLYSNILLSSPSHQVLLFEPSGGDHLPPQPPLPHQAPPAHLATTGHQQRAAHQHQHQQPQQQAHSQPPPPAHCSPYASPLVSAGPSSFNPNPSHHHNHLQQHHNHNHHQRSFSRNLARQHNHDPALANNHTMELTNGSIVANTHSSNSSVGSSLSSGSSLAAIVSSPFNQNQKTSKGKLNC